MILETAVGRGEHAPPMQGKVSPLLTSHDCDTAH